MSLLKGVKENFLAKKNQDEIVAYLRDYQESMGELSQLGQKIENLTAANPELQIVLSQKRVKQLIKGLASEDIMCSSKVEQITSALVQPLDVKECHGV